MPMKKEEPSFENQLFCQKFFPSSSMEERYKGCLRNIFVPESSKRQIKNTSLRILTGAGAPGQGQKSSSVSWALHCESAGRSGLGEPPPQGHPQHLCPVHLLLTTAPLSKQLREYKIFLAEISVLVRCVQ